MSSSSFAARSAMGLEIKLLAVSFCSALFLSASGTKIHAQFDGPKVPISLKAELQGQGEELAIQIEIENTGDIALWIDPELVLGFEISAENEDGEPIKVAHVKNAPSDRRNLGKDTMQQLRPGEKVRSTIYPFKKIERCRVFSFHLPAAIYSYRFVTGAKPKSITICYSDAHDLELGPMITRLERLGKDYRKVALPKATETTITVP
jgi:hypothetical protein